MPMWRLLAALWRRRVMTLVGVVLTLAAVALVARAPGVYWAQTTVTFLGPPDPLRPGTPPDAKGLVDLTSIIERDVNAGKARPNVVAPSVTIVDEGIRRGERVTMPNDGGQWLYVWVRPQLDVQAADSSPEAVQARMQRLLRAIDADLARRQDETRVAANKRVVVERTPGRIEVHYAEGVTRNAAGATLLLGALGTAAAVTQWDQWRGGRRHGRHAYSFIHLWKRRRRQRRQNRTEHPRGRRLEPHRSGPA